MWGGDPSDLQALTPAGLKKGLLGILDGGDPHIDATTEAETTRCSLSAAARKTMAGVTKTRHPHVEGAPSAVRHRRTG